MWESRAVDSVVAPVSTSAEAMPAWFALSTAVSSRSPIMMHSPLGSPTRSRTLSAVSGEGLPTMVSQRTPVHASIAAMTAAASG